MTPKKPVPGPAKPEPTDAVPPEASTPATAPAKKMMKSEAMDRAIAAGADMPVEAVAYVKKHFGLDISNKQFSTHKSLAKQKADIDARLKTAKPAVPAKPLAPAKPALPKTAVAKPAAVKPTPTPKSAAPVQPATSKPSPADLARTLKALVADHGAAAVSDMLSVFGKR